MQNTVMAVLFGVLIIVVIYLVLREVICWHLKINERINLQKEQNSLLERILLQLMNESKDKLSSFHKEDDKKENDANKSKMHYDVPLTPYEEEQVNAFINYGFKPGQKLVINKTTRKVDRFDEKEWNTIDQSEWIILFDN